MDAYLSPELAIFLGDLFVVRNSRFARLDPDHHVHPIKEGGKSREAYAEKMARQDLCITRVR